MDTVLNWFIAGLVNITLAVGIGSYLIASLMAWVMLSEETSYQSGRMTFSLWALRISSLIVLCLIVGAISVRG